MGFIALSDAAPIIVAHEQGIFRRLGLNVSLQRELGWATVRDKIAFGELDAAQAISSLLISCRLGLDTAPAKCLTACVLSTGGNAITLSRRLRDNGVKDASSLHDEIMRTRHDRQLVFGVAAAHSTHYLHLCDWLASGGINPRRDVRIVVVPPAQVFRNLSAGTIDGYCVGEPWNSLAIQEKLGWCVKTAAELHPGHPEKVLMVSSAFAQQRHEEHILLIIGLLEACELCDEPAFRPELVKLLTRREYLSQSRKTIAAGLVGPFKHGNAEASDASLFIRFFGEDLNPPSLAKAQWLVNGFRTHGLLQGHPWSSPQFEREIFRPDIYAQAIARSAAPSS
ncbi:MAG: CmpA/NrtA family ABC transporter substrate-binding protein [Synoicihabitans sp.]